MTQRDCVQPNEQMLEQFEKVDIQGNGNFAKAHQSAWREAETRREAPMLIAWWDNEEKMYSPVIDCKGYEDPAWLKYAKAYGSDLAVRVDNNRFIFLFTDGKTQSYQPEDAKYLKEQLKDSEGRIG